METFSRLIICSVFAALTACSSRPILQEEVGQFEDIRKEYESKVTIKETTPPKPTRTPRPASKKAVARPKAVKSGPLKEEKVEPVTSTKPDRRPLIDPFAPGESVALEVTYLNMAAGVFTVGVEPFKEVNGRRAYHFKVKVESRKSFSRIYSVSNSAETFVDFETLVPISLTMDQNESSRLVESRTFFDWKNNTADLWEKQVSKKRGEKKKELHWEIPPYSQNVISAIYYIRTLSLKPGMKFEFPVADDGKNYIVKGQVLRAERITTEIGELDTLVVKPEFHIEGSLKPTGENLLWFTNDDRKFLVRIKAKVKIGSLYADVISLRK